jgi:hypothetical protein
MLHHHLPQLISQLASLGRHAVGLCHAATRMVTVVLHSLELLRNGGRAAFSTIYPRQKREPKKRATISRPPPLLIHYQIFKNAGTSFEWALEQALGSGLQRLDTLYRDDFISRRDIGQHVRARPEALGPREQSISKY